MFTGNGSNFFFYISISVSITNKMFWLSEWIGTNGAILGFVFIYYKMVRKSLAKFLKYFYGKNIQQLMWMKKETY